MKNTSDFDKWYFVNDKCDTRFCKKPIKNRYYYCKDAWDHQQSKIEQLQRENDKLKFMVKKGLSWDEISVSYESQIEQLQKQVEVLRGAAKYLDGRFSYQRYGIINSLGEFENLSDKLKVTTSTALEKIKEIGNGSHDIR